PLGLLGLVAAVLALTALASPWAAWGAAAVMGRSFSFARVYDRVFEVLLVVGVLTSWRRLDLGSATGIGFRRQAWARELARGLAIGLTGLAVGLAVAALFGGLVPALRFPPGKTLRKALLGVAATVAITAGEETLFRGVVLRRIRRDAGDALAVVATTLAYAAVHVLRARSFAGPVHAWSGVAQTITLFAPLASGAALPQLLGLALLGWLLAVARLRSGARTIEGFAFPPVAFITWPTRKPSTRSLPPRNSAACAGCFASTSATAASSAPRSLTCARPSAATSSAGSWPVPRSRGIRP